MKKKSPMAHPQTIQIFLPDGDPQGIRIASITTRIVQLIEIPRLRLPDFLAMSEAGHVGLYLLFGEDDETGHAKAYIGQTGNLGARLKQHHDGKDFWNRALVALSLTHSLTVTHAHYLEWLAISRAAQAGRCKLENSTTGTRPHTPAAMEAECREIFETIDILLTTLGFPVFKSLTKRLPEVPSGTLPHTDHERVTPPKTMQSEFTVHIRNNDGVDAHARYTEEGLVVLRGSIGRKRHTASFLKHHYYGKREALFRSGALTTNDEQIVVTEDLLFNSPTPGAVLLLGRAANGWTEWKDDSGITLEELTGRISPAKRRTDL
ncbi:alkylhydroperoxidase/carboxymuconolactone decarboxylase family protein YurZ [Asaia bogorensis NBRC 16594]|nr:alkylhydroperoxidase/carboxymuconolactone decarboxylase family protein YurZ [Asaia bogorensis NBRC 16594]